MLLIQHLRFYFNLILMDLRLKTCGFLHFVIVFYSIAVSSLGVHSYASRSSADNFCSKSVCPSVKMDVKFTGSWYDEEKEKQAAQALIDGGCVLISQHADSMGAPTACENKGIPNVSYNGSTAAACPETFLISSRINWAPYFEYMITQVKEGKEIAVDWVGTLENGAVMLTELGKNVAAGTADKLELVKKDLKSGAINVFDTRNFTVKGETLTSYKADVDFDKDYAKDTEVIENGVFLFSMAIGVEMPILINMAIMLDILISILMLGMFLTKVDDKIQADDSDSLTRVKD